MVGRSYGISRLKCLIKDPNCIFTFWDINEQDLHRVLTEREMSPATPLDLGLYQGHPAENRLISRERIEDLAGSRFMDIPLQEESFFTRLLVRTNAQDVILMESNIVATPRSYDSYRRFQEMDVVKELYQILDEGTPLGGSPSSPWGGWRLE